MIQINQNNEQWLISGDVVFANASKLLSESLGLNFMQLTVIDFAQVTDVDTSAISLMLEWERRANAQKAIIKYINLSPNLLSLTTLYGVDEIIAH